jgi:hypothetical protein
MRTNQRGLIEHGEIGLPAKTRHGAHLEQTGPSQTTQTLQLLDRAALGLVQNIGIEVTHDHAQSVQLANFMLTDVDAGQPHVRDGHVGV